MGQKEATIVKAYVHNVISKEKRNQTPAGGTKGNVCLFLLHEAPKHRGDSAAVSPRLRTTSLKHNPSPALASLLPPHAHVYWHEPTGTQEPHLPVVTQKCLCLRMATRWMDPWPLSGSFAQGQRGRWSPMFPVQSLQKEMRSGFHNIARKLPLQSRIFIFRYYTLECFIWMYFCSFLSSH